MGLGDGGGGLFLLRLVERLEGVVAGELECALDLLLFGVPGGGIVAGEGPSLGSGVTSWVAGSFIVGDLAS